MYEVELKAKIDQEQYRFIADKLSSHLKNHALYIDSYFDSRSKDLYNCEKELRVRKIISNGGVEVLLTFKDSPFDNATKSKPEFEVLISDVENMKRILGCLGYTEDISLEKDCRNYSIQQREYRIDVTLVYVKELNQHFIEIEIREKEQENISKAKEQLFQFLKLLNIDEVDLKTEYYTEAIRAARKTGTNKTS